MKSFSRKGFGKLIFLLNFIWTLNSYAVKIKMVDRGENKRTVFFANDSVQLFNKAVEFSPDSETCAIHAYNSPDIMIYDSNKNLLFQFKYDFEHQQQIALANDHRFITYGWSVTENLVTTTHATFYDNTGNRLKDSVFYPDFNALFIENGDLVILHAVNPLGNRGYKDRKDTRVVIFDNRYKVKLEKSINYPTDIFLRPLYNTEKQEYKLLYIDTLTNETIFEIIK